MAKAKSGIADNQVAVPMNGAMATMNNFITQLPQEEIVSNGGFKSPYIVFTHKLQKVFPKINSAYPNIREGTPVLISPDDTILKIDPMRFSLLAQFQFWSREDASGSILEAYVDAARAPAGVRENIDTIVCVYTDEGCKIARCRFKTTKCPAAKAAVEAAKEAATDAWYKKGNEYALTKNVPFAHFRYVAEIQITSKTSKSSGLVYQQADAVISPTTSTHWSEIQKLTSEPEFKTVMEEIQADFLAGRTAIEKLVK